MFPTSISMLFESIESFVGNAPNILTFEILFSLLLIILFCILTVFVSVDTGNSPAFAP